MYLYNHKSDNQKEPTRLSTHSNAKLEEEKAVLKYCNVPTHVLCDIAAEMRWFVCGVYVVIEKGDRETWLTCADGRAPC